MISTQTSGNLKKLLLNILIIRVTFCHHRKLEEALASYRGTVILVSHDRYLLKKVCTRVLSIENQTIRTYLGGFKEYHESYKAKDRRQAVDKAKWDQEASPKLCTEERLLLETRLARLNSQLSMMTKDDPNYQDIEKEFFEIAGRLR
jgi:macrolide transport system ATP-binding/permease protein